MRPENWMLTLLGRSRQREENNGIHFAITEVQVAIIIPCNLVIRFFSQSRTRPCSPFSMQNVTASFDVTDRMMKLNQTVYNAVVSIIIPNYQIVEFQVYRYNKISNKEISYFRVVSHCPLTILLSIYKHVQRRNNIL